MAHRFGRAPAQFVVLQSMLTRAGGADLADPETKIRAQQFLRYRARIWFEQGIDIVRDASDCELAGEEVVADSRGDLTLRVSCVRDECDCQQVAFIETFRDAWGSAGAALESSAPRPADQRMGKLALQVLNQPNKRKGQNCYDKLGDVSIAMECDANETLLTTDRSFDTICPAIGVAHTRVSTTTPTKLSASGAA